ncbi:glycoside hydrolase family 19 protein [Spirosoma terrae]|uniref:Glycoside hydrolase family 19 protein n=1 Tax=Spirosoma terrae TaxID=1968276 RepID=A0A6L9LDJ3_9BACT|nr:glycoside hydrolase family 19 protein [Spirosoma terrae]NDU97201.1 glycoside hydrolase family 19 protein [Spirosoma terrae]
MKIITLPILLACGASPKTASLYVDPINRYVDEYAVTTHVRLSHFLSQVLHESIRLTATVENLSYSAEALVRTWPSRFYAGSEVKYDWVEKRKDPETGKTLNVLQPRQGKPAGMYARQPEKIANYVYANRLGNGTEESGDGWKYRGRGPIQNTGKTKYIRYKKLFGIDYVNHPEYMQRPDDGMHTSFQFWADMNLNVIADKDNVELTTRKVNGGINGLADRTKLLAICKSALRPIFYESDKVA